MIKKNYISQVVGQMGASPSTLRYWEKQGLLHFPREGENGYRIPDLHTMIEISEVLFYRSLSLPLEDIRKIPDLEGEELEALLERNQEKLLKKIQELELSLKRIEGMKQVLKQTKELQKEGFSLVRQKLPELCRFSFEDGEAVEQYIYESYQSAVAFIGGKMEYGVFLPPKKGRVRLRAADREERQYVRGLFLMNKEGESHNLEAFRQWAQERGRETGDFVARYLTRMNQEGQWDCREGFLEIK